MKAGCCGLGIVGMIIKFVSKAIDVLVAVIVYCGLFYPIFYMVAVLFLMMLADFTFKPSIELTLFYVGLVMAFACSVMTTVRNLILLPFGKYLDKKAEEKEAYLNKKRAKRRRRERERYSPRYLDRSYEREEEYRDRVRLSERRDYPTVGERPRVYRSSRDRNLIIYEYRDRFDVYVEVDNRLRRIDTKWK